MEYKPKIDLTQGITPEETPEGELKFEGINFNYPTKSDVQVLKNVDLQIHKNKVVAFVGASGCGKSTMIALIERFYDPNSGELDFDKNSIRKLRHEWFHKNLAIV